MNQLSRTPPLLICEKERRNVVILELKHFDSFTSSPVAISAYASCSIKHTDANNTSFDMLPTLSVLQAYYDDEEKQVNISDVGTLKEFRGRGYATILIKRIVALAEQKGYKTLTLDDCSDLFMKPNNIYLKLGFQYVNANQPEMIKYLAT